MKKLKLLIFMSLAFFLTANAQITKGNWLVGGSGSFTSTKAEGTSNDVTTTSKGSSIKLYPNVGYFIADKFAVGLNASFTFSNPEGDNNNSTGIGVGPFARYYFLKTDKTINVFSQLAYTYGKGTLNSESNSSSNNFVIKGGPAFYFNSSVALELTLEYNISNTNFDSGSSSKFKSFIIGVGFQIHLDK